MTPPYPDPGTPQSARVTNFLLGGKDHFEADRSAATHLLTYAPEALNAVRQVRLFGHRAVQWLARCGMTQFIDLGCGLPMPEGLNVHEIAHQANPLARVLYVDRDPIVLVHARALLAIDAHTTTVDADLTHPAQVLDHPLTGALLDLSVPVAVLCLSVGHLISDHTRHRTLTTLATRLPAGSVIVYGQLAATNAQAAGEIRHATREAGLDWHLPPTSAIAGAFDQLQHIPPRLDDLSGWRPDPHQRALPTPDARLRSLLGTGPPEQVIPYGGVLHLGRTSPDKRQENQC